MEKMVPASVTGEYRELVDVVMELERRVAPKSPFYMAKYVIGTGSRLGGKLWGWNFRHVRASRLLWWVYANRARWPWGPKVYLEWCRGSRKSTLLQAAAVCFLLDDQNLACLMDSDTMVKSEEKGSIIRSIFSDDYFISLFGDLRDESKWGKNAWNLKRTTKNPNPTMKASGLAVSKTGGHFNIIFCDDLQTDDNCDSPTVNEDVKRNYRLYASLQTGVSLPMLVVAGTRWGFRDLGNDIQKEAEDEKNRGMARSIFIDREAAFIRDKNSRLDSRFATFSEGGLTVEVLRRYKATQKPSLFSFNYLLEPLSEDEALFKSQWVRHHQRSFSDFRGPENRIFLSVDPAGDGSKGSKADSWAFVVIVVTPGAEIYVLHATEERMTKKEGFERIVELNDHYQPNGVILEQYFQAGQLASWMRDQAAKRLLSIPWMKFKMDRREKPERIAALQPFMQSGKILWRKEHVELEDNVVQYPRAEHDDLVDCLAQAVKYAYVPQQVSNKPFYMDDNYLENGAYTPTPEKPEPDVLAVMAARAKYLETHDEGGFLGRRKSRFSFGGRR